MLSLAYRDPKWYRHFGRLLGFFSVLFLRGREFLTGSAVVLFGIYPKKLKIYPNKYRCT